MNDGDLGPRIMVKDGRVKRLNNAIYNTRTRDVSPTVTEEEIIAEKNYSGVQITSQNVPLRTDPGTS